MWSSMPAPLLMGSLPDGGEVVTAGGSPAIGKAPSRRCAPGAPMSSLASGQPAFQLHHRDHIGDDGEGGKNNFVAPLSLPRGDRDSSSGLQMCYTATIITGSLLVLLFLVNNPVKVRNGTPSPSCITPLATLLGAAESHGLPLFCALSSCPRCLARDLSCKQQP